MALCLVVEDEVIQRRSLQRLLEENGCQVLTCATGADALDTVVDHLPELVLLDLGLPDADGIELLPKLLAASPLSRVIVLTGNDSVRDAVAALRAGARHYLVKPWDQEELLTVLARERAAVDLEELRRRESDEAIYWGTNRTLASVREMLHNLASSPMTPVLIVGETGTGKEAIARELHRLTSSGGPFVPLNCAAIPRELMESELFGHEKGAFTGADSRRRGVVELANRGTLFLDEVGEMAVELQAKLLRFLQDGSFRPVGAEAELRTRCRVIAATNANLERALEEERFRADLYYRLSVVTLTLPPLRERPEDLLPLAHFLLQRIAHRLGRKPRPFGPRAEAAILGHRWPGNVRELANRIERALVLGNTPAIEPEDLGLNPAEEGTAPRPIAALEDPARLRRLLEEEGWNLSRAARRLGVERHRLKYRVQKFGLRRPDNR